MGTGPLEREVQDTIIDLARMNGWRIAHFRPAKTEKGWRTAVSADGKGFPDLVLVRDRVIFAELKRTGERLKPDQKSWRDALILADAEWYLWTIQDLPEITRILAR